MVRGLLRNALIVLGLLLETEAAKAGAWTLPRGHGQVLTGVTFSNASKIYDGAGHAANPIIFNKMFIQSWMEYGASDALTLIAVPEYIDADWGTEKDKLAHIHSASIAVGGRLLLTKRLGIMSMQVLAKRAGSFNMSYTTTGDAGNQFELRFLCGDNFRIANRDGYVDFEVAHRFVDGERPNEISLDAAIGLWLQQDSLLLLQGFSTTSRGTSNISYSQYKLEASLVHRINKRWGLQSGYFFTPAGRNIVQESGSVVTIWFHW
jgi:hypothetical protein